MVFIAALSVAGAISDRLGRRFHVVVFVVGLALLSFPLNWLIQDRAWQLGLAMAIALIFMAFVTSILAALFAEMFPTHVRASGMAVPYSIAVVLFGDAAQYLQTCGWRAAMPPGSSSSTRSRS
jgi:MHS family alpha-ketoglutarate permease-like MFS transporter